MAIMINQYDYSVKAQVQATGSSGDYITTDMKSLEQVAKTTAAILEIIGQDASPAYLQEMVKVNILQDPLMYVSFNSIFIYLWSLVGFPSDGAARPFCLSWYIFMM